MSERVELGGLHADVLMRRSLKLFYLPSVRLVQRNVERIPFGREAVVASLRHRVFQTVSDPRHAAGAVDYCVQDPLP